ncbi:hypothetical protein F4811DRAFT_567877 [Daldinia bambusicola]|nr:hypothetical protein F4811DRAFT_567877 [Daldinia bambusicola]
MSFEKGEAEMVWAVTDERSASDKEREEVAYAQLLKDRPGFKWERWQGLLKKSAEGGVKYLFEIRKEPPCVGNSYFHYMACMNAFERARVKEEWAFHEEQPETHAPPFSLAYLSHWYDQTFKGESAEEEDAEQEVAEEGEPEEDKVSLVPADIQPTDLAHLIPLWDLILAGDELEEGEKPFEIVIPASRDIARVLASSKELECFLAELSEELCGTDAMVFCKVGDILRPTTLIMRPRAGVDITSPSVKWRFSHGWDILCLAAEKAVKEDVNILNLVREVHARTLLNPTQSFSSSRQRYKNALKDANEADEESRQEVLKANERSKRHRLLSAALRREMLRLANEVSEKLLEGEATLGEKAKKLVEFVEKGDPAIPISRPSARARVAELRSVRLAEDLVTEVVQPESALSSAQKSELVKLFVSYGDERLPYLFGAPSRFALVQRVWPPLAEAENRNALNKCDATLAEIRADVNKALEAPLEVSDEVPTGIIYSDDEG